MARYLVLDLDGTVAPIGKPASPRTAALLSDFEKSGFTIVFCSGKPTYYLTGFARQLGLDRPVLIGENGAQIVYGVDLPPETCIFLPVNAGAPDILRALEKEIRELLGDEVWFQPNAVALTPFPRTERGFAVIGALLDRRREELEKAELHVYRQCDCFDILPQNFSKGAALGVFLKRENASKNDAIAVGDGVNDLSMFPFASLSVGIGGALEGKADLCYPDIETALMRLYERFALKKTGKDGAKP